MIAAKFELQQAGPHGLEASLRQALLDQFACVGILCLMLEE